MWCTNRLLWHTNSDFYGIRTPTFTPYEPFLMGVGVVFKWLKKGQKSGRTSPNLSAPKSRIAVRLRFSPQTRVSQGTPQRGPFAPIFFAEEIAVSSHTWFGPASDLFWTRFGPEILFFRSESGQNSTPNVTGRRFHRTMEMIPARSW